MVLVIDASNILSGGGLHHLIELIHHGDPHRHGFQKVVVCAPVQTLRRIENRPWLDKRDHPFLDRNYFYRWQWRRKVLREIVQEQESFLFCAGTINPPFKWPYVTICQNLLPIDLNELLRFGFSMITFRLLALRYFHFRSYRQAIGVIFLTHYCYQALPGKLRRKVADHAVIPHGLNKTLFFESPVRKENDPKLFSLLYVSIINAYKHQDKVIEAVINLNRRGIRVKLTLVGPSKKAPLRKLNKLLVNQPDFAYAVDYFGAVAYEKINRVYHQHDGFIFASTCETFGMIITEAMASGLPIICSKKSSLPETVQDAAIYCDPESLTSIEQAIEKLVVDKNLQEELIARSLARSKEFTWERCSQSTFEYLGKASRLVKQP